jgi:hypothetical protein
VVIEVFTRAGRGFFLRFRLRHVIQVRPMADQFLSDASRNVLVGLKASPQRLAEGISEMK